MSENSFLEISQETCTSACHHRCDKSGTGNCSLSLNSHTLTGHLKEPKLGSPHLQARAAGLLGDNPGPMSALPDPGGAGGKGHRTGAGCDSHDGRVTRTGRGCRWQYQGACWPVPTGHHSPVLWTRPVNIFKSARSRARKVTVLRRCNV